MMCPHCKTLGKLDAPTVVAIKRVMGTVGFAALVKGEAVVLPLEPAMTIEDRVAQQLKTVRDSCSSTEFVEAVLHVLSLEHGMVRISLKPLAKAQKKA
jgi:hypothetical protein